MHAVKPAATLSVCGVSVTGASKTREGASHNLAPGWARGTWPGARLCQHAFARPRANRRGGCQRFGKHGRKMSKLQPFGFAQDRLRAG